MYWMNWLAVSTVYDKTEKSELMEISEQRLFRDCSLIWLIVLNLSLFRL